MIEIFFILVWIKIAIYIVFIGTLTLFSRSPISYHLISHFDSILWVAAEFSDLHY